MLAALAALVALDAMQNLSIQISTVNGTGSLTANRLLTKMLFRAGFSPGSYNFFPSNIAGLPCYFFLRLSSEGWTALQDETDLLISLNPETLVRDLRRLKPAGALVKDAKNPLPSDISPPPGKIIEIPFNEALQGIQGAPIKLKKALKNIIYTGLVSEWMGLEGDICQKTLAGFLSGKAGAGELGRWNLQAFQAGRELASARPLALKMDPPPELAGAAGAAASVKPPAAKKRILIDGNSAMALGAIFSSCRLISWYPITPATGLAESFEKYAGILEPEGEKTIAAIQAEDEMAALGHVLGAGWAGLRAMTATSGPGLSLMAEGAGLGYFAEVPAVICNVQRAGPSTGLPTRTSQGDLLSACFLSHGDTKHIVLLPGAAKECFDFSILAFDLADRLQTPIILLSDLDLAMNLAASPSLLYPEAPIDRGKILSAEELEKTAFARYSLASKDGVSPRALPGAEHVKSGYLTRGSGHDEKARYSEEPDDYRQMQDKLKRKWRFAARLMPKPVIHKARGAAKALVTFGKNESACLEAADILLRERGLRLNFLRILSYPPHPDTWEFLKEQEEIYIAEQNRDGQLRRLLLGECSFPSHKAHSILRYDGRPLAAQDIVSHF